VVNRAEDRGGFTLPEAIIALTISSVLVLLVGTLFRVQNDFFSHVFLRSQVQENARSTAETIATELRSVGANGFLLADSTRMAFYSPLAIGMVCGAESNDVVIHLPGGIAALDTTEVGGFAYRNPSTRWSYYEHTWSQLKLTGGAPAATCYANGADTTGVSSEFVRLAYVDNDTGFSLAALRGASIAIVRKTEFKFAQSQLVEGDRALYWGTYGGTLRELVTGVSEDAHFEFRYFSTTWAKYATGTNLANVDAVRVVAESIGRGETSGQLNYDFGFTVDIPLPNAL
jgi:prepilin-type N-terminal cleavage/methylation domain-containing protein